MINNKPFERPVMYAYELLARCKHLTLGGQDEDGELEWIGTKEQFERVEAEERQHDSA